MPELGESPPSQELTLDITDQAITMAAEGIKKLIAAREPDIPLSDLEGSSVDVWLGLVQAAGFLRGKWLSDAKNIRDERSHFNLDHPEGYPT